MPSDTAFTTVHPKQVDYVTLSEQLLRDNPVLCDKIVKATGLELSDVPALLQECLKFLYLIGYHQRRLSPSHLVDMAWHEFILHTHPYCEFCDAHFGRYIHHTPGGSDSENAFQFRKSIAMYVSHFGTPPEAYWGTTLHVDASCGSCGGGDFEEN